MHMLSIDISTPIAYKCQRTCDVSRCSPQYVITKCITFGDTILLMRNPRSFICLPILNVRQHHPDCEPRHLV